MSSCNVRLDEGNNRQREWCQDKNINLTLLRGDTWMYRSRGMGDDVGKRRGGGGGCGGVGFASGEGLKHGRMGGDGGLPVKLRQSMLNFSHIVSSPLRQPKTASLTSHFNQNKHFSRRLTEILRPRTILTSQSLFSLTVRQGQYQEQQH